MRQCVYACVSWHVSCCIWRCVPSLNAPLVMPTVCVPHYCSMPGHKASLIVHTHIHKERKRMKKKAKWQRGKMPLLSFALSIRPAGWQWVIHGSGTMPTIELAHWHQASRPAYSTVWPCRGCGAKAGHSLQNSLLHWTLPFILCTFCVLPLQNNVKMLQ